MQRPVSKIVWSAMLALALAAQFYQPVRSSPASDPASSFETAARPPSEVAAIVKRSCGDCHSNQTVWPWYSRISPVSWLVAQDVQKGRSFLNLSEWRRFGPEMARARSHEMCEEAMSGRMPLWYYLPLHPAAKLTQREIAIVCTSWWRGDEGHIRAGAANPPSE